MRFINLNISVFVWTDASGGLYPQLSEFMGLNLNIEAIKAFSTTVPEQTSGVSFFAFVVMYLQYNLFNVLHINAESIAVCFFCCP